MSKILWMYWKTFVHIVTCIETPKMRVMLVKSQNTNKPCILYNNKPLEVVYSLKNLGHEIPSYHWWNECATHYLVVGKNLYNAFESIWNGEKSNVGFSRNTSLTYWSHWCCSMELKCGALIFVSLLVKSLKSRKKNLMKILEVDQLTTYMFLLLEIKSFPIMIMAMERLIEHMLKVTKCLHINFLGHKVNRTNV